MRVDERREGRPGSTDTYDGRGGHALMDILDLPRVEVYDSVTSTLDVTHALAESGAPAGTLVLAEQQTAGRGRGGRVWTSAAGAGIWLTLLERPRDPAALETLALRVGLRAARVLDRWTDARVQLKWPNDLFVRGVKLAGILVEARWRDTRLEWAAIGLGVNMMTPRGVPGAALRDGTSRVLVLSELIPALRSAASASGPLSEKELAAFAERDIARGKRCREPEAGVVKGIDARGGLIVEGVQGDRIHRSGSLVLEPEEAQ